MRRRRLAAALLGAMLVVTVGAACSPGTPGDEPQSDTSAMSAIRASSPAAPVDTQRVALAVKGMFCESCESTVTAMLRRTPGVLASDVSAARSEAVIMYDSTRTTPAKLVEVIGTLGYTATLKGS
jgi:copper chaperone CopZ